MVIAEPFNQIKYFTRTVLSLTHQRCTGRRTVYDFLKLFMPSEGALGVLPTIICCFFVVQFVLHHLYFLHVKNLNYRRNFCALWAVFLCILCCGLIYLANYGGQVFDLVAMHATRIYKTSPTVSC